MSGRLMRCFSRCLWGLGLALTASSAGAHAILTYPTPRDEISHKLGPCGVGRTRTSMTFVAGQTLEVRWNETFEHPGYYRVSFSASSDANFRALADNLPNPDGLQPGSTLITLPSQPCTACTLQLIQVMVEPTGISNYYSCADIILTAPPSLPDAGVPPTPDSGTPPASGADGGSVPAPSVPGSPAGEEVSPSGETEGTGHPQNGPPHVTEVRGGCDSAAGAGIAFAVMVVPAVAYRRRQRTLKIKRNAPRF